jgi:RNA polymerase sigma factor (TIGR02999 family)
MKSREGAGDTGFEPLPGAAANDDGVARGALFAALYDELHRLARRELARRGPQATLSPTTLLHEAYLDIVERDGLAFPDRSRFMGYAARVMRGLLVDHARNRCAQKRGGLVAITSLRTDVAEQCGIADDELVRVGEVLEELARNDASLAELVDLKFFCGFSVREIAALRGVSERTVQRDWEKARAYLYRGMRAAPAE